MAEGQWSGKSFHSGTGPFPGAEAISAALRAANDGKVGAPFRVPDATIDSETGHVLAYVVTEPYCNDSPVFERLIGIVLDADHRVARVLADAAYDNKDHWNAMRERGIDFIANIHSGLDPKRRNSSTGRFRGCSVRGMHVRRILEVGREKWKEEVGYGERWRIEATFGDLKRRFGDTLWARARKRVADMIGFLVQVFNRFKSTRMSA